MKTKRKDKLILFAIMFVSATLMMLARGAAIGVDVRQIYPFFIHAEILGGVLIAFLESFAFSSIVSAWSTIEKYSTYWWILATHMMLILIIVPVISTPAIITILFDIEVFEALRWSHILNNHLTWMWVFAGASVTSLIAAGIGFVHGLSGEQDQSQEMKVAEALLQVERLDPVAIAEKSGLPLITVEQNLQQWQTIFSFKALPEKSRKGK